MRIKIQQSAFARNVIHKETAQLERPNPSTALHEEEHGEGCSYLPLPGGLCPVWGPTCLCKSQSGSSRQIAYEVSPAQKSSAEAFSAVLNSEKLSVLNLYPPRLQFPQHNKLSYHHMGKSINSEAREGAPLCNPTLALGNPSSSCCPSTLL